MRKFRKKGDIKKKKKRLFLLLIALILILLIVGIYLIRQPTSPKAYNKTARNLTMPEEVIINNTQINDDESLSFVLINYKKVSVNCSAVMTITDSKLVSNLSARTFLVLEKPLGVIKPKQAIEDIFSGFRMPSGQTWLHVAPNCTEL